MHKQFVKETYRVATESPTTGNKNCTYKEEAQLRGKDSDPRGLTTSEERRTKGDLITTSEFLSGSSEVNTEPVFGTERTRST